MTSTGSTAAGRCALLWSLLALAHASGMPPVAHGRPTAGRAALLGRRNPGASLLPLRGGGDESAEVTEEEAPAGEERAEATAPEEPPPTLADEAPPPSCWSAVQQLLRFLGSLLKPNHGYATKSTEDMFEQDHNCGYAADDESWRTQRKKLNVVDLSPATRKRVLRDLRRLKKDESPGLELEDAECLTDWVIKMVGPPGTVFADEIYRLRVRLHPDYPTRPPTVTFMRPAPMYEHVYTNGMICLDLLSNAWDPQLDVLAVCLSIQSMLSSAKQKPPRAV